MTAISALLGALPRLTLVVGKGGVGKTTCAIGIAAHLARSGQRTLLVSTDPAAALATAVGAPEGAGVVARAYPSLEVRQLAARAIRTRFLERWRDTIVQIVDRGTYLDLDDIGGLVDAAFPGADEIFALLALSELVRDLQYERIVVDTAPTGHTLRLLALPQTFQAFVSLLDAMQEKHRFMVRTLTHRYRRDSADALIDELRGNVDAFSSALHDAARAAAVIVTRAEPVVAAETARLERALAESGIRRAAIIVNALAIETEREDDASLRHLTESENDIPRFELPCVEPPAGLQEISALFERLATSCVDSKAHVHRMRPASSAPELDQRSAFRAASLVRDLTIVGGKGGVGKTTVSCALAIAAADAGHRTLLVSTDPAPSIGDALRQEIGDEEVAVTGVAGLTARQMDASAAFARFRDRYRERIDALFDGMIASGVDASHDRGILRELLALAPPGMDEVYSLSELGETLGERRYARIIVDPAPTGHLLRLLEMPALALDWSHRLMRLMLKYKEITGLGDAAQELLAFAKRTRAVDELLRDRERAGLIVVSLDEPLVRTETERVVLGVQERGLAVVALVWNRARPNTDPLPSPAPAEQLFARLCEPPPIGVAALREFLGAWHPLPPAARDV